MPFLTSDLRVIQGALIGISDKVARDYTELEMLQSSFKGTNKFAQMTLTYIKTKLIEYLQDKRPDHGIKYRGQGEVGKCGYVVELEAEINLLHSIPYFCIAIALMKEGQLICGAVESPGTQETFLVEATKGAYLNNRRIRVSQRGERQECIVAGVDIKTKSPLLDMCNVASGKYDAAIVTNPAEIHELGVLFVKETGGLITREEERLIVTNNMVKVV